MNALFARLFDDAAIFPPGNVPMGEAVAAHRARQGSPLVGPFVCSLARFGELALSAEGPDLTDGRDLEVSLVLPGPVDELPVAEGIRIVALEGPSLNGGALTTYVEIACPEVTATRVAALRDAGLRLKIRTGGVRADAFPSEAELAGAIWAAVRGGLAFKLTAGLHDPIRHRDPVTGFEHHGFLNVLLATARALQGYEIERALVDQDGDRVAAAVAGIDEVLAKAVRHHFISFGTCSVSEPVAGLRRYRLISEATL